MPGQEMSDDAAKSCLTRGPIGVKSHDDRDPGLMTRSAAEPDAPCPCAIATAGRRTLLAAGVGLGVGLAARMAGAQADAARDRPKEGDLLVKVGSAELTPLGPDSLPLGAGQVMAWPMDPVGNIVRDGSRLNKVLLVRLDPSGARPEDRSSVPPTVSWPIRRSVRTPAARWSTGPPIAKFSNVRATTHNTTPRRVRGSSLVHRRVALRRCRSA